jgi:hypothetical protein
MNYEKEYIDYLISNKEKIKTDILDSYFYNKITFEEVLEKLDTTKMDILSYEKFVKEIKIKEILG